LKLGVQIGLDEIRADEMRALMMLEEGQERVDREKLNGSST
jgi:hypothetical protein